MIAALLLLGWLACGVGGTGFFVAYLQNKWPSVAREGYRADLSIGLAVIPLGPIWLLFTLVLYAPFKYGWSLAPRKDS